MDFLLPLIYIAVVVVILAGMWKVFVKAGQPGWGVLVPIYNAYLICKIAGRPGWWLILMLIPVVSLIVAFIVFIDVARKFGQSAGFGVGLTLLGFIFFPILGFGDATYDANA